MKFRPHVWSQLRNISVEQLISALQKDGWAQKKTRGAIQTWLKKDKVVAIHYHPKRTYGPGLLRKLLADIGWTEEDIHRLGLIK